MSARDVASRFDGDATTTTKRHCAFDCDETAMHEPRPTVRAAKGLYLWLEGEDQPYLDLIQGYSTTIFGHADDQLVDCAAHALRIADHVSGMTSGPRENLANLLAELSPIDDGRVYFDVGGAHIISLAVRLARRVTGRRRILALHDGFHGYSTEGEKLSQTFIGHAEPAVQDPEIDLIEVGSDELISRLASGLYAALLVEPLQGANGLAELPRDWVMTARAATRGAGTLLIDDEVQVGVGRTGAFAAIARYGVRPDVIAYGKALCAGIFPLSALVVSDAVYRRIPSWPGSALGSTFSCSPFGCAVGLHVVRRVEALLEATRIHTLGRMLGTRLQRLVGCARIVGVRQYGLGVAVDFMDRAAARRFVRAARAQHGFLYACGRAGNVVKVYPPYTTTEAEAQEIVNLMEAAQAQSTTA